MKILKDCKNSSVVWRSSTYVTYMLWNELVNWCLLDCCIIRYVLFKYFPSFRACKVLSNLVSTLLVHKSRCYMVIFYVIIMYLLTLLGLGRLKIKGEEELMYLPVYSPKLELVHRWNLPTYYLLLPDITYTTAHLSRRQRKLSKLFGRSI